MQSEAGFPGLSEVMRRTQKYFVATAGLPVAHKPQQEHAVGQQIGKNR
jgi:hypothetical protein